MNGKEFRGARRFLGKTQREMADLLGNSIKAVHSYEQGWRRIPPYVERHIFFLLSRLKGDGNDGKPCWEVKKCPPERREKCPAWEFRAGDLCWFVSGNLTGGDAHKDWHEKMKVCRSCRIFTSLIPARS